MKAGESVQKNFFEKGAFYAWIDGASSGNPGPAGAGVVLKKNGEILEKWSSFLGETTNNVAEYSSLILALERSIRRGIRRLIVFTDSEFMYRQLIGAYKVRKPHIRELYERVQELKHQMEFFRITHIPREENKEADRLARAARKRET